MKVCYLLKIVYNASLLSIEDSIHHDANLLSIGGDIHNASLLSTDEVSIHNASLLSILDSMHNGHCYLLKLAYQMQI